jgi:hypothetical protein
MSHKFRLDQTVLLSSGSNEALISVTRGKVTRLMPKEGADYHYYILTESDGLERRVQEHQLRPMDIAT